MDPVTGRFVSEDPAGHGNNWLIYCADAPTCAIDRDGRTFSSCQFLWYFLANTAQIVGLFLTVAAIGAYDEKNITLAADLCCSACIAFAAAIGAIGSYGIDLGTEFQWGSWALCAGGGGLAAIVTRFVLNGAQMSQEIQLTCLSMALQATIAYGVACTVATFTVDEDLKLAASN